MNSFSPPRRTCVSQCARLLSSLIATATLGLQAQPGLNVRLPAPAQGAAAIQALGAHLPAVARAYGLEAQGLTTLLRTQPSLGVDQDGALFFACEGPTAHPAPAARARQTTANETLLPNSSTSQLASGGTVDAFQLHSFPGATRVIYLDFTGHTTSGTSWNSNYTGGASIVTPAFDTDGNPSSFSVSERAIIQSIWQRVAEDYAPFAIDVTTQDPGIEALRRADSGDVTYGVRVVIGHNTWYNANAGGVGYIGSFKWNSDTPCFVFSNALMNHDKYVAEAAAHEVGHTLGLYHDGASGTEYYSGQGNWAPVMGVGYYKVLTQFSKGEYAGASQTEDDLAIIATYAPIAGDDHGDSTSNATLLSGTTIGNGGTIETRADVDVFRFDTGAGNISLNIASPAPEPNVHLMVELLNSTGQVLQSNDPSSVSAQFATYLSAGTYYLRISGIGAGDPKSSGYSDYGSVGNYIITGTLLHTGVTANQAPVAIASGNPTTSGVAPLPISFAGDKSYDPDGSIVSYSWSFGDGTDSSQMSPSKTYSVAGNYTARLTVMDNNGATASSTVAVSVGSSLTTTRSVDVADYQLTSSTAASGTTASGTVTVRDSNGSAVADAVVTMQWSGVVSTTVTGRTDGSGRVTLTAKSKRSGYITGTVAAVTPPVGAVYDPSIFSIEMTRTVVVQSSPAK